MAITRQYARMMTRQFNPKRADGRLCSAKIKQQVRVGREILFKVAHREEWVLVRVTQVWNKKKTFKELLGKQYKLFLPDAHSLDDAVETFIRIFLYRQLEDQRGVFGFSFDVLDSFNI